MSFYFNIQVFKLIILGGLLSYFRQVIRPFNLDLWLLQPSYDRQVIRPFNLDLWLLQHCFVDCRPTLHWFLFSIELIGQSIVNSIFVAVVTNYYTQCQMILFYVKTIAFKLQEKSVTLKTAMKVNCSQLFCNLLSIISISTSSHGLYLQDSYINVCQGMQK